MNDFTKKELEEIHRCLKYMIKGGVTPYSCVTLDVKKKIHLMIDNYCEHECNGEVEIFVDTCKKCHAYLLRETHHDNQ